MKIIATCPVRNEDWCLALSLRAVLLWVDEVCVLDHASTDRTAEICREVSNRFPGRVHYSRDDNPEWQEMRHRQFLLDQGRERGATHIAIVDADEVLSGNLLPTIRSTVENAPARSILQLPWACLARSVDRYYVEGVWFNNWVSTAFVDAPEYHWAARNGYDFHHRHPMGRPLSPHQPVRQKQGGLMHLQFVSERRLRAKQALYKMTEVLRWPSKHTPAQLNAMYGRAVYESDPAAYQTAPVPAEWWEPYAAWMKYLGIDAEPWQEQVCRDLVKQHGRAKFTGLDLFGVA